MSLASDGSLFKLFHVQLGKMWKIFNFFLNDILRVPSSSIRCFSNSFPKKFTSVTIKFLHMNPMCNISIFPSPNCFSESIFKSTIFRQSKSHPQSVNSICVVIWSKVWDDVLQEKELATLSPHPVAQDGNSLQSCWLTFTSSIWPHSPLWISMYPKSIEFN